MWIVLREYFFDDVDECLVVDLIDDFVYDDVVVVDEEGFGWIVDVVGDCYVFVVVDEWRVLGVVFLVELVN